MRNTPSPEHDGFPKADALAAMRAWYAGLDARKSVVRYLGNESVDGQSARAILTGIRNQIQAFARRRRRDDLAAILDHPAEVRVEKARLVQRTIEEIRTLTIPVPMLSDSVDQWLPARAAVKLKAVGLLTLADVVPRMLHRRRWWAEVPGLGVTSARELEELMKSLPGLAASASSLAIRPSSSGVVPWERMAVKWELDGGNGILRAPAHGCTLSARTDVEAINAWLGLQEATTTARAYRKEAERLVLWATLERGKAMSSLQQEDAVAYRAFLRSPFPRDRWVGPARPRKEADWRPFQGDLSPRSTAYALSVVSALFRWLVEQRYLLANPFAGLKVKGSGGTKDVDISRALTKPEWTLLRIEADMVELRHGWSVESAWRLRFLLDFWLATGLRPSEFVGAKLGNIDRQVGGESWLYVRGKGDKPARVALPQLATAALDRYLAQRGLPVTPQFWEPNVPLLPSLIDDNEGLTTARVWAMLKRFFGQAADELSKVNPALSSKLRRATPHWLRHCHATLALAAGVSLKTVRDNLRHASIATTSVYLDADDVQRSSEIARAFAE